MILVFIVVLMIKQTLANPGSVMNASPTPITTQRCNNVYFYEAPNKKIESLLREIKKQLTQLQNDVNTLKGNNGSTIGMLYE